MLLFAKLGDGSPEASSRAGKLGDRAAVITWGNRLRTWLRSPGLHVASSRTLAQRPAVGE